MRLSWWQIGIDGVAILCFGCATYRRACGLLCFAERMLSPDEGASNECADCGAGCA